MAWFVLLLAGLLEVVWALGLPSTEGFSRPLPSVITAAAIVGSMLLLAKASQTLPIGTAYSIWVGIGAVGASVGGALLYGEAMSPRRAALLVVLVLAIVGLKLESSSAHG